MFIDDDLCDGDEKVHDENDGKSYFSLTAANKAASAICICSQYVKYSYACTYIDTVHNYIYIRM